MTFPEFDSTHLGPLCSSLARSPIHLPVNLSGYNPPPQPAAQTPLRCKKEWSLCLSLLKRCLNLKPSQLFYGLERLISSHVLNRSRAFCTNTNIREGPRLNLKPKRENPSAAHSSSVKTAKQIHLRFVCMLNFYTSWDKEWSHHMRTCSQNPEWKSNSDQQSTLIHNTQETAAKQLTQM